MVQLSKMRSFSVVLFFLTLFGLNSAQKTSKEESAEQKEPEWVDNPEIELRKYLTNENV